jgi:hypothetical protein
MAEKNKNNASIETPPVPSVSEILNSTTSPVTLTDSGVASDTGTDAEILADISTPIADGTGTEPAGTELQKDLQELKEDVIELKDSLVEVAGDIYDLASDAFAEVKKSFKGEITPEV